MTMAVTAGCGSSTADKAGDAGKKIVVGLDDNFPPMGFKNESNEIVGFDIDLAKEASKRLGREVEFKAIDWSSKEAELKSGRVDILWNGLDITEKRKENMLFSDPYMDNRQIIFVKKGRSDIKDEASMAGKVIGTQSASSAEEYMDGSAFFKEKVKEVFPTAGGKWPRWVQGAEWPLGMNGKPMRFVEQKRKKGKEYANMLYTQFFFEDVDTGETRVIDQFT
jgi:polar amino acid transport system substrate-binding protein